MALPSRPQNIQDLIKNILQATTQNVVDNPNEVLNDFVPATEATALADSMSFPNFGHSGTYLYNDATSMYGKAQYS